MTPLRRLREGRGISQKELGRRVGLTQTQISRLENDIRSLTIHRAKKIAEVLQCHWLDLVEEEPRPDLQPDEQALVGLYRGLAEDDKNAVFRVADAMAQQKPGTPKRVNR